MCARLDQTLSVTIVAPGFRFYGGFENGRRDSGSRIDLKSLRKNWSEETGEPQDKSFGQPRFLSLAADDQRTKNRERLEPDELHIPFHFSLCPRVEEWGID